MFKHPKYYAELRKLRKEQKLQATSKLQAPSSSKNKRQASSSKQQASSSKPEATSSLILEPRYIWKRLVDLGPRFSAMINVLLGCVMWKAIWCGLKRNFLLLVTFSSTVKKWPLVLYPNRSGMPGMLRFSTLFHIIFGVDSLSFLYNFCSGPTSF